jgi:hypothetical protein
MITPFHLNVLKLYHTKRKRDQARGADPKRGIKHV